MKATARLVADFEALEASAGIEPGKVPFYKPPGSGGDPAQWSGSNSITSFLCTDLACDPCKSGRASLDGMVLKHGDYRPEGVGMLSNGEELLQVRSFLTYALTEGRRGTPHR